MLGRPSAHFVGLWKKKEGREKERILNWLWVWISTFAAVWHPCGTQPLSLSFLICNRAAEFGWIDKWVLNNQIGGEEGAVGSQADPWRDDLPLSVALGSIHMSELSENPTAWLSMTAESHATHGQPSGQPCDASWSIPLSEGQGQQNDSREWNPAPVKLPRFWGKDDRRIQGWHESSGLRNRDRVLLVWVGLTQVVIRDRLGLRGKQGPIALFNVLL